MHPGLFHAEEQDFAHWIHFSICSNYIFAYTSIVSTSIITKIPIKLYLCHITMVCAISSIEYTTYGSYVFIR